MKPRINDLSKGRREFLRTLVPTGALVCAGGPLLAFPQEKEKQKPVSVHAVDFEVSNTESTCRRYSAHTSSVDFVQARFDALLREWERDYVLD